MLVDISGKKKIIIVLGIIAVGLSMAYFFMDRIDMNDPIARYKAVMAADMVGGKTPQETLDLFIVALRADDVEKAAGYFMLDDNLSRAQWVTGLAGVSNPASM